MAGIQAKVVGYKELQAKVRDLGGQVSPPELAEVMLTGAEVGARSVRREIMAQHLYRTGTMFESVEAYRINQYAAGVRVNVPYAAPHEFGATIKVPVTEKSRAYFWHMYYETGDEQWKAMALSPQGTFTVVIEARPYFRPGIDKAKRDMVGAMVVDLRGRIRRVTR